MLWILIAGVLLWSVVHLFPSVLPIRRNNLIATYGNQYKGMFSLLIVLSLVLIVLGWRGSDFIPLYDPPTWGRHLNMLLMLAAVILFGAFHAPHNHIRYYLHHPMLTGVVVWGVGHLFANGDERSVTLFGGMIIWALINMHFLNQRDGKAVKPVDTPTWQGDARLVGIALVIYTVLIFLHPYFAGVPVLAR